MSMFLPVGLVKVKENTFLPVAVRWGRANFPTRPSTDIPAGRAPGQELMQLVILSECASLDRAPSPRPGGCPKERPMCREEWQWQSLCH